MNTQKELVEYLITLGVLKTPRIINAFKIIDRADFVRVKYRESAYDDCPLPIGYGQTISQPQTVAFMLELLQLQISDKVLDVGAGSGWTTALMGKIVGVSGFVRGVELIPELVAYGQENLAKYNMSQVTVQQSCDSYGLPKFAPYDKILVSATSTKIQEDLIEQLVIGGQMVIPVKNDIVLYIKQSETMGEMKYFHGFSFVPLKKIS